MSKYTLWCYIKKKHSTTSKSRNNAPRYTCLARKVNAASLYIHIYIHIRMESLCHVEADRYIGYVHYVYTRVCELRTSISFSFTYRVLSFSEVT